MPEFSIILLEFVEFEGSPELERSVVFWESVWEVWESGEFGESRDFAEYLELCEFDGSDDLGGRLALLGSDGQCVFTHSIRGVECAREVRATWRALFLPD